MTTDHAFRAVRAKDVVLNYTDPDGDSIQVTHCHGGGMPDALTIWTRGVCFLDTEQIAALREIAERVTALRGSSASTGSDQ